MIARDFPGVPAATGAAVHAADWERPWFQPLAAVGRAVESAWQQGQPVYRALSRRGAAVEFVPQQRLPPGMPYEQYIHRQRQVPTRDNWHDFFNGLLWCALPHTKARLNAIQADEIARLGIGPRRGAVRDAATLFDENAALLHAPQPLWQALAARRWEVAFVRLRPLWEQARLLVFGHAALEKLLHPYKSITLHAWPVAPAFDPAGSLENLDRWLAADLSPTRLAAKPFVPLPVLGVPGWWPQNEDPVFYCDPLVFRPAGAK